MKVIISEDFTLYIFCGRIWVVSKIMDLNAQELAYIGDAVYEIYIRKYLINKKIRKVNNLQKEAKKYVSAIGQSTYLKNMINNERKCMFLPNAEIPQNIICTTDYKEAIEDENAYFEKFKILNVNS